MDLLTSLNTNKVFWGLTMITVNIGSKYVIGDLNKFQNIIVNNDVLKVVIVFAMFFIGTRDILTALFLTVVFLVVIKVLINEQNPYNILPQSVREQMTQATETVGLITEEQYRDALVTIDKYRNMHAPKPYKIM